MLDQLDSISDTSLCFPFCAQSTSFHIDDNTSGGKITGSLLRRTDCWASLLVLDLAVAKILAWE